LVWAVSGGGEGRGVTVAKLCEMREMIYMSYGYDYIMVGIPSSTLLETETFQARLRRGFSWSASLCVLSLDAGYEYTTWNLVQIILT
jgi:hypothetical protein